MSDLNEMAEALHQYRTSTEAGDKASAYQVMAESSGVAIVRARLEGEGRPDCLDCGCDIPVQRRQAVKNAVRCVECAEIREARRG